MESEEWHKWDFNNYQRSWVAAAFHPEFPDCVFGVCVSENRGWTDIEYEVLNWRNGRLGWYGNRDVAKFENLVAHLKCLPFAQVVRNATPSAVLRFL